MEYYNEKIAKNDAVDIVWVPADNSEDEMEQWAKDEKFPWPTVKLKSARSISAINDHRPGHVPGYVLVDAEGNSLATGKGAIVSKIEELTGSSTAEDS